MCRSRPRHLHLRQRHRRRSRAPPGRETSRACCRCCALRMRQARRCRGPPKSWPRSSVRCRWTRFLRLLRQIRQASGRRYLLRPLLRPLLRLGLRPLRRPHRDQASREVLRRCSRRWAPGRVKVRLLPRRPLPVHQFRRRQGRVSLHGYSALRPASPRWQRQLRPPLCLHSLRLPRLRRRRGRASLPRCFRGCPRAEQQHRPPRRFSLQRLPLPSRRKARVPARLHRCFRPCRRRRLRNRRLISTR